MNDNDWHWSVLLPWEKTVWTLTMVESAEISRAITRKRGAAAPASW
jgi:hypothetical protein